MVIGLESPQRMLASRYRWIDPDW